MDSESDPPISPDSHSPQNMAMITTSPTTPRLPTSPLLLSMQPMIPSSSYLYENVTDLASSSTLSMQYQDLSQLTAPTFHSVSPTRRDHESPDAEQRRIALKYLSQIRHRAENLQDECMDRLVFLARLFASLPIQDDDCIPLLSEVVTRMSSRRRMVFAHLLVDSRRHSPFLDIAHSDQVDQLIHENPLVRQFGRLGKPNIDDPAIARARIEIIRHIGMLQNFIDARILSRRLSPNRDEAVINAVKMLALLYTLNEERKLVPYAVFYNEAINDHLEIKEDFPHFRAKDRFSFCEYPFVLTPTTKSDILKVESMIQMRHELQDAFFRVLFIGVNSPYLVLEIRRDHLLQDALDQLESKSTQDLRKQLRVQFVGEEGIDEGGVQKEFFQLVVREIFDPKYGMFIHNEESRLWWFGVLPPSYHIGFCEEHHEQEEIMLNEYNLLGRMFGLAIYNSVILDVHFPLTLYKKLHIGLHTPGMKPPPNSRSNPSQPQMFPTPAPEPRRPHAIFKKLKTTFDVEDLAELDPSLGHGLDRLLKMPREEFEEAFGVGGEERFFIVDVEYCGGRHSVELKPEGSDIRLEWENRQEFVDLYVDFIFNKSVEKQFRAFQEGFETVCADSAIRLFRPEEIEQLVCGSADLDFHALEQVTHYDGGFHSAHPTIRAFWQIVHEFPEHEKKRLLFFTTGSDRVPIGGLGRLQFVIARNGAGDSDRLPTSHTCYNVLLLCEYENEKKLRERLLTALGNAEGFGMI